MNAIGYRPNKVELTTCWGQTAHPWDRKLFTYGNAFNNITVYFTGTVGAIGVLIVGECIPETEKYERA